MNELFKPCPFCGNKPTIVVCDNEGNVHYDGYEFDPWSGLGYRIVHYHEWCPAATDENGSYWIYDTREEAIENWNRRVAESGKGDGIQR